MMQIAKDAAAAAAAASAVEEQKPSVPEPEAATATGTIPEPVAQTVAEEDAASSFFKSFPLPSCHHWCGHENNAHL